MELGSQTCEQLCECWRSNVGSVEQQPVLLATEPPLQPPKYFFLFVKDLVDKVILGE